MSRPSATRPGGSANARCRSSSAVRTAGIAATREAPCAGVSVRSSQRDVLPVQQDALAAVGVGLEPGIEPGGQPGVPGLVVLGEAAPGPGHGDQPVQRAAVEQVPAEALGDQSG